MLNQSDYKNYTLEQSRELPELAGTGYLLRHDQTGARVLLIENEDKNKVFNIGFRTPPADDTGVAHILEHSVLCGSAKFPSKDPFIELAKGSMNTFLNAMTYPDKTVYPIASCNDQDYHNLMHVYLDAVFFPNIYKKDEILKQEGWHYELDSPEDELKFNGVVYNEMKGVFSSPDSLMERKIQSSLYKDTPYAFESGGDPDAIPELTRENFLAFHTRYYHPSNSYIYLYGNVDFKKELAFIDQEYLSRFDRREVHSEIALQEAYSAPVTVTDTFSVSEGEEEQGAYFSYNVSVGDSCDNEMGLAMQILDAVLFTMPGAPVKQALIDAGLGKDVDSFYEGGIQQPFFSVTVKKATQGREKEFLELLESTLRRQVKEGINKKAIYSIINNYEFKYREASFGSNPKGLIYGLNFLSSWLYDDSKAMELADSLTPLARLKEKVETGFFEELIEKAILNNPHKSYVYLYPEPGKNEKMEEKLQSQMEKLKASLNRRQLQLLIEDSKRLKIFQETPSTEEELQAIPSLTLDDLPRKVLPFSNKEMEIGGVTSVVHEYHTNGIVYFNFCFDISELPAELIRYSTLLVDLYRFVDTEHFSYNDLAMEINLKIGGVSFSTGMNSLVWKQDGYRPYFNIRMKCMEDQVQDGMALIKEILLTSRLDDKKRIREIISEIHTKMDARIPASGHVYAANRAMSYVDPMMYYKEEAEGMGYYEFIKDLDRNFDARIGEVIRQLRRTQNCIFRKNQLTVSLTGEFDFQTMLEEEFKAFSCVLWDAPCVKSVPLLIPRKLNEGYKAASKVQYVAGAGCYLSEDRPFTGALHVLKTILSYDYLWVNVRVTGGAYGCMCSFSRRGYGFFTSYRDPNLTETLDTYRQAGEYIRNFEASDRDMTRYIIGTVSAMDQPLEPAALGARSFAAYQSGMTVEMVQKERNQILESRPETIRSLAPYVEAIISDGAICAIGNENKIEENKEIFATVRNLTQ